MSTNTSDDHHHFDTSPGMTLGTRLKQARMKKGWNQTELAKQSGVRQATISRYESDQRGNPAPQELIKLARALEIGVDFLLGTSPGGEVQEWKPMDLVPLIASVADEGLRIALSTFIQAASSPYDMHTITRFAMLRPVPSRAPEQWLTEMRTYADALRSIVRP